MSDTTSTAYPASDDVELAILENIYLSQRRERPVTQRDLATTAGLSLGMTNVLLKRFSEKGWLLLKRVNSRNIQYALTPEGIDEIAHRTYRYFRRSVRDAGLYRELIEGLVIGAKKDGIRRIVLAGVSDLDFILDWSCERHGLIFVKAADPSKAIAFAGDGTMVVKSDAAGVEVPGSVSLATLLAGVEERPTG